MHAEVCKRAGCLIRETDLLGGEEVAIFWISNEDSKGFLAVCVSTQIPEIRV
jgi:hypothetical protein